MITFLTFADIDECSINNPCDPNAHCQNIQGSYNCTCQDGYSGDGFFCQGIHYILLASTLAHYINITRSLKDALSYDINLNVFQDKL